MKVARYYKNLGAEVEWYSPLFDGFDKVYMSKVFTHTPDCCYYVNADEVFKGGTGYDYNTKLPTEIDSLQPDYSIYPYVDNKTAYGFLTRGCPN